MRRRYTYDVRLGGNPFRTFNNKDEVLAFLTEHLESTPEDAEVLSYHVINSKGEVFRLSGEELAQYIRDIHMVIDVDDDID